MLLNSKSFHLLNYIALSNRATYFNIDPAIGNNYLDLNIWLYHKIISFSTNSLQIILTMMLF